MRTTYRMIMSDGSACVVENAMSAGEAQEEARWRCRGLTISTCHSGLTVEEARLLNEMFRDNKAMAGLIWHDVLPHVPIAPEVVRPKAGRRQIIDSTEPMFTKEAIGSGRLAP